MPRHLRIATFNCENLFRRTRILNLQDERHGSQLLEKASQLQRLLGKEQYSPADRDEIYRLSSELQGYVNFRVDSGGLGAWKKDLAAGTTGYRIYKSCGGCDSWVGEICFEYERFSDPQRMNTARVIKDADADVLCTIEVEGMDAIDKFNSEALKSKRYPQFVSIDSPNDPRGIDIACLSRLPIVSLKTHIFDSFGSYRRIFSRDCLEVTLEIEPGRHLHVLCNHFKSQRATSKAEEDSAAAKRLAQAKKVVEVLTSNYSLQDDLVAVMGDLNEDSSSQYQSLKPLFDCPDLVPVVDPAAPVGDRYSHYYDGASSGKRLSQLDYIFVSKPLHSKLAGFGFIRNGIFGVDKEAAAMGAAPVKVYDSVTDWNLSASDHAALWAEFLL